MNRTSSAFSTRNMFCLRDAADEFNITYQTARI